MTGPLGASRALGQRKDPAANNLIESMYDTLLHSPLPTLSAPKFNGHLLAPAGLSGPPTQLNTGPDIGHTTWAHFLGPYLRGEQPCIRSVTRKAGAGDVPERLPVDLITRDYRTPSSSVWVFEGVDFGVLLQQRRDSVNAVTRAQSPAVADLWLDEIRSWYPKPPSEEGVVPVEFWQSAGSRLTTTERSIEAPLWSEVAHHYPGEVGGRLSELVELRLEHPPGRIVLWHGPPGTGKTSAIRALARAWADQARFQVVLEPERVFSDSSGLMQVLLDGSQSRDRRWRVLVVEDADDLVRVGGRSAPVLSRLLNVGDGLVGQGLRILVLLTTNEPPTGLHPALSRPGRCLSDIPFRAFTSEEARLAFPGLGFESATTELTLAKVMNGAVDDVEVETHRPGTYL